jgi:hypothetical protein
MFYIDRLFGLYKEEMSEGVISDKSLGVDLEGDVVLHQKLRRPFTTTHSIQKPQLKMREAYMLVDERGIPFSFILSGYFLYPYYVAFKASEYFNLGNDSHQLIQLNDETVLIETDNIIFLTEKEISRAIYLGEAEVDLLKIYETQGFHREVYTALKIRNEFNQIELEFTKLYRERGEFLLDNLEHLSLPSFPIDSLNQLPMVASVDKYPEEEFSEHYILSRDRQSSKLYIHFDQDCVGKFGYLVVNGTLAFSGYLPKALYLGLDEGINLKSLNTVITLHFEEKEGCLN